MTADVEIESRHTGSRYTSYVSSVIDAPVAAVWDVIRPFEDIGRYYPIVTGITLEERPYGDQIGVIRAATLDGGMVGGQIVRERLVALSDVDHSFSYALIDDASLPMCDYLATVQLLSITDKDQTFIQWKSNYQITGNPETVKTFLENDVYLAIMHGLQKLCENLKSPNLLYV